MEPCTAQDLERAGATLIAQGKTQGVAVGGWRIESSEDHILDARELLLLSTRLGNPYQSDYEVPFCVPGSLGSLKPCSCGSALVMGVRMHLPEGVFGHNWLQLVHEETGAQLRFDVGGALMQWVLLSVEHGSGGLKVPAASVGGWAERWPTMFQTQEYDWTYGTDYCGDATAPRQKTSPHDGGDPDAAAQRRVAVQAAPSAQSAQSGLPCSLPECAAEASSAAEQARNRSGTGGAGAAAGLGGGMGGMDELAWEDCGPGMIDMELLTRQEPILFYKHLILFEDFLHDNGVAQLSLKVRVMPSCWFVLLRYWLRVDGVTLRLRDTRCFHAFGTSTVVREHSFKEAPCPKPEPISFPFPAMDAMPPRAMPPQSAGIGTTLPPAMMAAAGQLPTGIGPLPPDAMHPMMRPPVIKVIDTPEEAAKMLQHHPAKEHRCTLLKLKSLTVAAGAGNSESEAQLEQQSALTLDLSPLDQDSGIELDDWIECCATAPPATDPVLASGGAAAYSGGGFVAFGCADGEILLLKSGAAGEETVESARFLAHGDADLNFEAATMSLCFSPPLAQDVAATAEGSKQPGCSRVAIFTRMLASSGEDGRLRVWSVDSVLSKGKGDTTLSLRCEVSGLDGEGADYRRRGGRGSESVRVPSVQLVACAPSVHPTATDGDVGAGNVPNLAVAVGRSLWLVELSRDWCSHRSSVQLGNIHSTATDLRFAELPELGTGTALLAACYGAVSIWDAPTLQRSVQTQAQQAPSRRLDYKGPLLGLSVSTGGAFVGAGCQDATMHVWRIPGVTNGKARAAAIATAIASTSDSAVQPMPMVEDAVTAIAGEEERVAVIPKPAVRKSAAAAAITEVSCGGYAEKVICNEWSTGGLFLATAGGQHAIVWDFTQDDDDDAKDKAKGGCAFTFPVGKKEAAAICYGHERRVTAIAFGPHAVDPQTKSVKTLLATADEAGVVLIYRISSSPGGAGTEDGSDRAREYFRFHAGIPNIYYPVARCGHAHDGSSSGSADGIARLAWVGGVLHAASDGGTVQRWAMNV